MKFFCKRNAFSQIGVIVDGGGINFRHWIEEAKKRGFSVSISKGYALLYK